MNKSPNCLPAKMKVAAAILAVLSLFSLILFPSNHAIFASPVGNYSEASSAILTIPYYPYNPPEQPAVDTLIADYFDARLTVEEGDYVLAAEVKYNSLTSQRALLSAYLIAANNIVKIISYADNPLAATNAMNAYFSAKTALINAYNGTVVMLYVNSNNADSKYALLQNEKNTYIDCILPLPYPEDITYYYTGEIRTFEIRNKDILKMTITGHKQTEANENGYDVKIVLKDKANTRWNDGSVDDLHYKFKIMKRTFTQAELGAISFEDKTFLHTGENRTLEIENLPVGLNVDYLSVNGKRLSDSPSDDDYVEVNGSRKVSLPFSTALAGEYVVTAHLVPDKNHAIEDEEFNRLSSMTLTATLTIKAQSFSANNFSAFMDEGFSANATFYAQTAGAPQRNSFGKLLYERGYINSEEQVPFAYLTHLVVGSEETQPSGTVCVTILIPQSLRNKEFSLFQITKISQNVSEISEVSFEIDGNHLSFQTSTFSSFAFVSATKMWYSNVGSIILIVLVSLFLFAFVTIFVLYLLWKKRGRERFPFLLSMFKKINKVFYGTTLNDVQLVERGRQLLEKANERQKIDMQQKTLSQQKKKLKAQMEENLIVIRNLEKKKKDKNAKSKK